MLVLVLGHVVSGQQPAAQAPRPSFRGGVNLVLVDVDVRDRSGRPLPGLKQSDFEILEDGKAQEIVTFAFEEISVNARAVAATAVLSTTGARQGQAPVAPPSRPRAGAGTRSHRRRVAGCRPDAGGGRGERSAHDERRGRSSHLGAALRYEFHAAGGRAKGGGCRREVDEGQDDARGPGGRRVHRIHSSGTDGLHHRPRQGARRAGGVRRRRRDCDRCR